MKKTVDNIKVKRIRGYEKYYVSKCGKVWSDKKYGGVEGRWLKLTKSTNNYLFVNLSKNGKTKTYYIHQLVYFTWSDQEKKGHYNREWHVRHLDGDKLNNNLSNLSYDHRRENQKDRIRLGENNSCRGEDQGSAKLTETQVIEIRKRYSKGGISQRKLAEKYGVNHTSIGFIIRGEYWTHVGGPIKGKDY